MLKNLVFKTINPNIANAFSEAQVDTMIFIGQKESSSIENLNIIEFKNEAVLLKRTIEQKRFLDNEKYVFDVEVDEIIGAILKKIRNKSKTLN